MAASTPAFVTSFVGPWPALKLPADGADVCRAPAISKAQRADLESIVVRQWYVDDDERYAVWLNAYVPSVPDRRQRVNPAMPAVRGDVLIEMAWEEVESDASDASGVIDLTPHTRWALQMVDAWTRWRAADAQATEAAFKGRGRAFHVSCEDMRRMMEAPEAQLALACREHLRAIALPPALTRMV